MREGANTRRSLDLVRIMGKAGKWDGGFMIGHPVAEDKGSFNDVRNRNYDLWGIHAGRGFGEGAQSSRAELIFVATDQAGRAFDSTTPTREDRRTLSLRYAAIDNAWNYSLEGIRQWGDYGALDIDAYYVTGQVAYTWTHGWRPQLGLRVDVGSGDKDPNDGKIGTYGPLFPRPLTYNGDLGPHNLTVLQPSIGVKPIKGMALNASVAGLWRTSKNDGVYSLGGQVIRSGDESDQRYFATRFSVSGRYALNDFTTLGFYTNYSVLSESFEPGRDLFYAASYLTFRF
ncbi:alginate export family protein [Novosphingobium aureum]|uniref:alginate export family protein n=1 Tax=Novosphingobium aureum TaxID=2792964 RepID=UPI00226B748A|nr:alginate export family protein [Novosphingobium aureum]